jgi:hypothetical protein
VRRVRFVDYHDDAETCRQMEVEQATVIGNCDEGVLSTEGECRLIERSVLLVPRDIMPDVASAQTVLDLNADARHEEPQLCLHHSSRFADRIDIEPRMFAHLFPFGRGHPSEKRQVPVSKVECIRHYLHLSTRLFARDPTFLLTAFSRLSLEKMYTLTSVKCQRYP